MSYCFSKVVQNSTFEEAIEQLTLELKKEDFGILNQTDIQATLKKKINVDFKKYVILGACNPYFAHLALKAEDKIGVFLPCSFIVQEHENGDIEVSGIDTAASMASVENEYLANIAVEVRDKIKSVIENMK